MKRLLLLFVIILLFPIVNGDCTLNLDKAAYISGGNANAIMSCSLGNEKGVPYAVKWRNQAGTLIWQSNGTTPTISDTPFFASLSIPPGITQIRANLTGTNLEGYDTATISPPTNTTLNIVNVTFRNDIYIGLENPISYRVYTSSGELANGGYCSRASEDGITKSPISVQETGEDIIVSGYVHSTNELNFNAFDEDRQYLLHISCNYDGDGDGIIDAWANYRFPFAVKKWLNVNTLVDRDIYYPKQTISICANVTNIDYIDRLTMHIAYQVRCSLLDDNDSDLDRFIIISDDADYDIRGISANTTQMQCKRFIFPEARNLQGSNATCYASSQVDVLSKDGHILVIYDTISPAFTLVSKDLNVDAKWIMTSPQKFTATINLSSPEYQDYNGNMIGNLNIRLDNGEEDIRHWEQYYINGMDFKSFGDMELITNLEANYCNGSDVLSGIQLLEDGFLEIELDNVELNESGCYVVSFTLLEENNMLPIMIGLIAIAIYFILMGFITSNPSRLGNSIRWASNIIGYVQLLLIAALSYAYSIGLNVSELMRLNLWIVGLLGFGLMMLTLYMKSVELMMPIETEKDGKW